MSILRSSTCALLFVVALARADQPAGTSSAGTAPVPVVDEPRHKPVFENEYVRIIDVQFPAGDTTAYHVHKISSAVVELADVTIASQEWGAASAMPRHVAPGDTRYAPYDEKPLTHRVTNRGPGVFRVFDIELLRPRAKVGTAWARPAAGLKLQWQQKLARLFDVPIGPGQKLMLPGNAQAHLLIGIDGETKLAEPERSLRRTDYVFFPPKAAIELANRAAGPARCVLLELQ